MKDYTKRNANYRGIPCWFNPITNELTGKNWLLVILIEIVMWIDINIIQVDEFPIWIDVDDLEK